MMLSKGHMWIMYIGHIMCIMYMGKFCSRNAKATSCKVSFLFLANLFFFSLIMGMIIKSDEQNMTKMVNSKHGHKSMKTLKTRKKGWMIYIQQLKKKRNDASSKIRPWLNEINARPSTSCMIMNHQTN